MQRNLDAFIKNHTQDMLDFVMKNKPIECDVDAVMDEYSRIFDSSLTRVNEHGYSRSTILGMYTQSKWFKISAVESDIEVSLTCEIRECDPVKLKEWFTNDPVRDFDSVFSSSTVCVDIRRRKHFWFDNLLRGTACGE